MVKIMSYTDEFGETFAQSAWVPASINLSPIDHTGRIVIYGYPTAQAAASALAGEKQKIIGQKIYDITPESRNEFIQLSGIDIAGLLGVALQYAALTCDTASGELDENDQPVMVSFFDGAQDG